MNCHPLIILIILNFKREPTKSSLEIDSTNKIKFRTLYWRRKYSIENHPVYFTQIKKTIDIHSIMRS
jgi:hypothetical protein